jgi:sugar phosphate permease
MASRGIRREGQIFLFRGGLVLVKTTLLTVLVVAVVVTARPSVAFQHQYNQQQQKQKQNTFQQRDIKNNDDFKHYKIHHRPIGENGQKEWTESRGRTQQWKNRSLSTRLRGGQSPLECDLKTDKVAPKRDKIRRRGMAISLGLSNFSVMGAKCALPSVLSLLMSPDRGLTFLTPTSKPFSSALSAQNQFAQLLGLSTLSVALGKLLLGPVIDKLGGIRALQVTLLLLLSLLATITMTQRFWIFAACWVLVDFVFSSCWAACISSIQQSFPSSEWGEQIGHLATGARLGNAASFSLFAAILFALEDRMVQPWRVIFLVSTVLQVVPLCLLSYFGGMTLDANKAAATTATIATNNDESIVGNNTSNEEETTSPVKSAPRFRDSLAILRREATTPEFWLHLVSRSCLMVFASFLLFVPTLMNQVYGCSNAVAAQVASAYSLGCLASVSLGSKLYAALPTTKQQITTVASLLALATTASLAQLGHSTGIVPLSWTFSTLSMFVWGFAFSLPFYLPPSLYALARGGRECSASIADCFDFFGFSLLAWFNKYVASIGRHSNPSLWVGCFKLTTACSLVAMVAQSFAIRLEKKKKTTSVA